MGILRRSSHSRIGFRDSGFRRRHRIAGPRAHRSAGSNGAGTSGGWIQHQFLVSSIVTPTSSVQLRFLASDLSSGSIIEAAIDDLKGHRSVGGIRASVYNAMPVASVEVLVDFMGSFRAANG